MISVRYVFFIREGPEWLRRVCIAEPSATKEQGGDEHGQGQGDEEPVPGGRGSTSRLGQDILEDESLDNHHIKFRQLVYFMF